MKQSNEYGILISAHCFSTLNKEELSHQLVASLYDIESHQKISDGDNEQFEITDYHCTNVAKSGKPINIFIEEEIKQVLLQIVQRNGYDESLLDVLLFDQALTHSSFTITKYEIGRIFALAEIYFQIMEKASVYGSLVELVASWDLSHN